MAEDTATKAPSAQDILKRLQALSPDAQEDALLAMDKNVTKAETKRQKTVLDEHKVGIASACVDTLKLYCREKSVDVKSVLPLTVRITEEEGKGIVGAATGRKSGGGGGGGTRAPSFLKSNKVASIELNGAALEKPTESEVLRTVGIKWGKASPHVQMVKEETLKVVAGKNFIAVLEDGTKVPLVSLYKK